MIRTNDFQNAHIYKSAFTGYSAALVEDQSYCFRKMLLPSCFFFKVLVYGILSACVLNLFLLPAFCTDRASAADFIAPCIFILAGTAFLVFRMDRERVKDESEELRRSLEDQRNRFR